MHYRALNLRPLFIPRGPKIISFAHIERAFWNLGQPISKGGDYRARLSRDVENKGSHLRQSADHLRQSVPSLKRISASVEWRRRIDDEL